MSEVVNRRKSILKKSNVSDHPSPSKHVNIELNADRKPSRQSTRLISKKIINITSSDDDMSPDLDSYDEYKTTKANNRSKKITLLKDKSTDTPKSKQQRKKIQTSSPEISDENADELSSTPMEIEALPTTLFEEQDVSGKKMFGFQTPKKKGGMSQKAIEALNSPMNYLTPTKRDETVIMPSKTPYSLRQKMKKELASIVRENNSGSDFSDTDSDFMESSEDSSSSDESQSDSQFEKSESSNSDSDNVPKRKIVKTKPTQKQSIHSSNSTRNRKDLNYIMKTDEYFASHATSKIHTSNHTLQKLKNPKLSEDQLENLLRSCDLNASKPHEKRIKELFDISCEDTQKWLSVLNEGFSILLYGLGSKRNILSQFQKDLLSAKYPVVVVNGYFPSLTIKDIIDGILVNILEYSDNCTNMYECVDIIEREFSRMPNVHLYLIVHNIDGSMLRNNKSQNILASLAAIQNIHMVASIDHINTPLIWDHSKLSKFNFIWWDATSLLPYTDETSFEGSLLVQKSGALVLSSICSVYQSLTKNSKGIFMLIVKYQLSKKDEKHYQGMPFRILYSQCRENFLVSSDLALRAQLTEFLDHKLVKSRRAGDGTEQLNIPINNSILQQFSEQM